MGGVTASWGATRERRVQPHHHRLVNPTFCRRLSCFHFYSFDAEVIRLDFLFFLVFHFALHVAHTRPCHVDAAIANAVRRGRAARRPPNR